MTPSNHVRWQHTTARAPKKRSAHKNAFRTVPDNKEYAVDGLISGNHMLIFVQIKMHIIQLILGFAFSM